MVHRYKCRPNSHTHTVTKLKKNFFLKDWVMAQSSDCPPADGIEAALVTGKEESLLEY